MATPLVPWCSDSGGLILEIIIHELQMSFDPADEVAVSQNATLQGRHPGRQQVCLRTTS